MDSVNFISCFKSIDPDNSLEDEALIGWSSTCLDQTISYYIECNCNEISQSEIDED
jgi:hypothetical protein